MSVIPASQIVLMRKRKQLHVLMQERRWDEVAQIEAELFEDIKLATQDPQRSPKQLLAELGSVIRVYRELSDLCYLYGHQYHKPNV